MISLASSNRILEIYDSVCVQSDWADPSAISPKQRRPLSDRTKPGWQMHWKLPGVFLHVPNWQMLGSTLHSLMSVEEKHTNG